MIRFDIKDKTVAVRYPPELDSLLKGYFSAFDSAAGEIPRSILDIRGDSDGSYLVLYNDTILWEGVTQESILSTLCTEIENLLAATSVDAIIRGSAIKAHGRGVLILGPSGCGKTTLASGLINRGHEYLADNFVSLCTSHANSYDVRDAISCLPLPLALHAPRDAWLPFDATQILSSWDGRLFFKTTTTHRNDSLIEHCGLIIVPCFSDSASFEVSPIPHGELQFLLNQALHPTQRPTPFNSERISTFARTVPAVLVRFGNYERLAANIDRFIHAFLTAEGDGISLADFCRSWPNPPAPKATKTAIASPHARPAILNGKKPKLSIGMATYDDFDGVYFTLQALRMYHPETVKDVEYIVIDNNPDGPCAQPLSYLEHKIPNYRYIPVGERNGTAVRDYVMSEATADFVLNLDCHVLLVPGAVARLIQYFEANPDTIDFFQGPIVWDELDLVSTHMSPTWESGFFGTWALDERGVDPESPPFEIPMHGLGLYACRRAAWPGYNKKFRGFGGEEGYIHEKFRQAGGRTLCLPFLRWLHRFPRPLGVPYKISWEDRMRNYLIGASELGLPADGALQHFREFLGKEADRIVATIEPEIVA